MDDRKDAAPQGSGSSANAMPAGATSERPATEQRADRVPTPAVAAPKSTPPMHAEVASAADKPTVQCDACLGPFTPRKRWQRFCSPRCRNDWHHWTKTVREARELVRVALTGGGTSEEWNVRARRLLGIK